MTSVPAVLWTGRIGEFSFAVSPYVLFSGFGLIVALLLLEDRLAARSHPQGQRLFSYVVYSIPVGWLGAHILDWLVCGGSFRTAGFTFYGGLLAGLLAFWLMAGRCFSGEVVIQALNAATVPFVLAHGIGRVGCFYSGCCYGRRMAEDSFLRILGEWHPTQLYEAGFLLALALFLLYREQQRGRLSSAYWYLFLYATFRFGVEFLRDDARGAWCGLSTSQWLSLLLILPLLFSDKTPGVQVPT